MAIQTEHIGTLINIDAEGNEMTLYPTTLVEAVEGLSAMLEGKAPLDSEGKVPAENLPSMDYLPLSGGILKAKESAQSVSISPYGVVVNGDDGQGVLIANDYMNTGNGYVDGTPVLSFTGSEGDENTILRNIAGPVETWDAVNKQYVDTAMSNQRFYQAGATAPADKRLLWIDTNAGGVVKYHNGSEWTTIASVWS